MSQPASGTPPKVDLNDPLIKELNKLPLPDLLAYKSRLEWASKRHKHQKPPKGNWTVWLLLAGRGAGKTRAAAEWVWWQA